LNRRAGEAFDEAFEKKRKEELKRYEEKTGKHVNLELHDHVHHHQPHQQQLPREAELPVVKEIGKDCYVALMEMSLGMRLR